MSDTYASLVIAALEERARLARARRAMDELFA